MCAFLYIHYAFIQHLFDISLHLATSAKRNCKYSGDTEESSGQPQSDHMD